MSKKLKKVNHKNKSVPFLFYEEEVLDWYALSPADRFIESQKLWEVYRLFGGDYDPGPDTQSPFHIFKF